ncbi:MAG: hypothetical protein HZB51_04735 [Chloroflexi bacterium]|nr:hypothetical protein [Chloroflexota bacterium]
MSVHFTPGIDLIDYELSRNSLKRGESLVLMLYWQAMQPIDRDYTVFLHLVDQDGNMIAGIDGQPVLGRSPTSTWKPGKLVVDAIVLPIEEDVVAKSNCRLEIGLYHAPTMERLSLIDANGSILNDHVIIDSIRIQ